jgi:hypothetical protein
MRSVVDHGLPCRPAAGAAGAPQTGPAGRPWWLRQDITSLLRSAPPRAIVLPMSSMEGEVVMGPIHVLFALLAFGTAALSSG